MDITELLGTPDGAVLAAIGGEVALVTIHHETVNKVTIERFPLGAVAGVDAVLQLLGAHGFASREPAIVAAPVETLALPAPDGAYVCPECGLGYKGKQALGNHRNRKHGVVAGRAPASAPGDVGCGDCPRTFVNNRALNMHRYRVHGVDREPRREPVTGDHQCTECEARFETEMTLSMHAMKVHRLAPPSAVVAAAVAAPDDSAAILPAPSVSLDVAIPSESHSAPVTKDRKVKVTPVADGVCPVCHEPVLTHEQCDGCDVFIGPNHGTTHGTFIGGGIYCRDCTETRIAARKAELVAA